METMTDTTPKTQIERAALRLLSLKPNVTSRDRKEAQKKFNKGPETISRYLNGRSEIMDGDLAVKLISFFEGRIADRERFI